MASDIMKLEAKIKEMSALIDKIDVLTNDMWEGYFSSINLEKPRGVALLKYNFKMNKTRLSMIRQFVSEAVELGKKMNEHIINITSHSEK